MAATGSKDLKAVLDVIEELNYQRLTLEDAVATLTPYLATLGLKTSAELERLLTSTQRLVLASELKFCVTLAEPRKLRRRMRLDFLWHCLTGHFPKGTVCLSIIKGKFTAGEWDTYLNQPELLTRIAHRFEETFPDHNFQALGSPPQPHLDWSKKTPVALDLTHFQRLVRFYGLEITLSQSPTGLVKEFYDKYLEYVGYIGSLFSGDGPLSKAYTLPGVTGKDVHYIFKGRLEYSDPNELVLLQLRSVSRFGTSSQYVAVIKPLVKAEDWHKLAISASVLFQAGRADLFANLCHQITPDIWRKLREADKAGEDTWSYGFGTVGPVEPRDTTLEAGKAFLPFVQTLNGGDLRGGDTQLILDTLGLDLISTGQLACLKYLDERFGGARNQYRLPRGSFKEARNSHFETDLVPLLERLGDEAA